MAASYPTRTVKVDGINITVPTDIPSNERAEQLRTLYKEHVRPQDPSRPKGATYACVPKTIAKDVEEAMAFMGDIVDCQAERGSMVLLHSEGYYAHGF